MQGTQITVAQLDCAAAALPASAQVAVGGVSTGIASCPGTGTAPQVDFVTPRGFDQGFGGIVMKGPLGYARNRYQQIIDATEPPAASTANGIAMWPGDRSPSDQFFLQNYWVELGQTSNSPFQDKSTQPTPAAIAKIPGTVRSDLGPAPRTARQ